MFMEKYPKYLMNVLGYFEKLPCFCGNSCGYFWPSLELNGQLFITTYGHTGLLTTVEKESGGGASENF